MKIKKGDQVLIISGKDRGKRGKVLDVFPSEEKVVVDGCNIQKKHVKPRRSGEKGQIVQTPKPMAVSNIKLLCPKCGQPTRIGHKIIEKKKYRICKKCNSEI